MNPTPTLWAWNCSCGKSGTTEGKDGRKNLKWGHRGHDVTFTMLKPHGKHEREREVDSSSRCDVCGKQDPRKVTPGRAATRARRRAAGIPFCCSDECFSKLPDDLEWGQVR